MGLETTLSGLDPDTAYHWRARVRVDPTQGRPLAWGHWVYGGTSGDALGTHLRTGPGTVFVDADGDGFGDPDAPVTGALSPGYVEDATDCDDGDAAINPSAVEICDPAAVDEDCDGLSDDADDSVTGTFASYADADGDGYGDPSFAEQACDPIAGTDCDDADANVHPGVDEVCETTGTDEDCDGLVNEEDPGLVDEIGRAHV